MAVCLSVRMDVAAQVHTARVWLKWHPLPKPISSAPPGSFPVKRNKGEVKVRVDTRATTWSLQNQRRDRVGETTRAQLCGWEGLLQHPWCPPAPKLRRRDCPPAKHTKNTQGP